MSKFSQLLLVFVCVLCLSCFFLKRKVDKITTERDKYQQNTNTLLSDIKRIQIDSSTMAIDVKTLRFTLDEYKQYRTEDAKLIKNMGIRIKDLEATAKQNIIVNAPIQAEIRDTLILRDTISQYISTVKMKNPHLTLNCIIENDTMKGTIVLPVNLHQAIWAEYKYRFLWWRWGLKAIHQSVGSDNPYVQIKYSEYIYIK
ncbi:DUF6549 family protein [Parabacteroides goldsteinii]|uniref:DUF6549 family protein n=1 Tax=Parabacteroides goldsteinii TaxID=328812 RepID=UPI003119C2E9